MATQTQAAEAAREFSSLNEEDWKRTEDADEQTIMQMLSFSQQGNEGNLPVDFENIQFTQEGKADDAVDFEDISDDDLPDEEDATGGASVEVPGLIDDTGTSNETDDLFGEVISSPILEPTIQSSPPPTHEEPETNPQPEMPFTLALPPLVPLALPAVITDQDRALNFPEDYGREANQDLNIPPAPEDVTELVAQAFPTFRKGEILNFNEQLAPKPLYLTGKKPSRPPKALVPTKLSFDFEADQEKQFRIPGPATSSRQQRINEIEVKGQISCLKPEPVSEDDLDIFAAGATLDDDEEIVGGYSLADLDLVCQDWDSVIDPPTPPPAEPAAAVRVVQDEEDEWDREFLEQPPAKKRKLVVEPGLPRLPRFVAPSFDSFEEATARAAKRTYLDMADPFLLTYDAESDREPKRTKLVQKQKRMANGHMGRDVSQRFGFGNDQAYEQLKESHQSKVRAQLSNVQVEHSVPALKLLWPYYAIRPYGPEPYDYHRPQLKVTKAAGFPVKMAKPHRVPKKDAKQRKLQDLYAKSKDLSLNDNSTAVLFEYCEEIPTVLSNFGMGNKIINYYRRKSKEEEERPPRPLLGEQSFLLPEDKSPFSIFGTVDPGETVPTLHNPMFHAPIFKHEARPTDFLFGRTHTGAEGTFYYLRKIDHLFVVGQNFPLAEVPGPHSRKVTSLSKNRLKMVAYRIIHKKGSVSLQDITEHVKDSNDAQNRQKLKEFLSYDKESRSWGLKPGESLMDLATINTMIKPDEVCLLDAMQVGQNELAQNGYQLDDSAMLDDEDDDGEKDDMANSMVPWKTTKSFIDACSGKAMLQLHGAGDPTGRGLGFSFIKTSMKGGYMGAIQGPAATSADAIERERKANGGHSYNVKKQEALYNDAIKKIWGLQKSTLQDSTPHDDEDVQPQEDEDDRFTGKEPIATPAHVDDGMSSFSKRSTNVPEKRKLRITRSYRDPKTGETYTKTEIVHDPGVIAQYMKQRATLDMENIDPYSVKPTGNQDYDRVLMQKLESEEARLNRNKERRHAREKQKALQQHIAEGDADSPAPSIEKGGTTRKCANCGQKGHIKTNKKLCPMLNGTWKADNKTDEGTFGVYNAPPTVTGSS